MLPKVYTLLQASSPVVNLVGTRIYRHGTAPQGVVAPYITWFVPSSAPENTLDEVPKIDNATVQVDCWSNNTGAGDLEIETLAKAVRDAIEPSYHMIVGPTDGQDPETKRYRCTMLFSFWTDRT